MSLVLLKTKLNFIDNKFREYEEETSKRCRFQGYLSDLLKMDSMPELLEKYEDIQKKDSSFTLCNVNDRLIKNVNSMKTTMVFCIEEKMSQALNQFRIKHVAVS